MCRRKGDAKTQIPQIKVQSASIRKSRWKCHPFAIARKDVHGGQQLFLSCRVKIRQGDNYIPRKCGAKGARSPQRILLQRVNEITKESHDV